MLRVKLNLRLPPELKKELVEQARRNDRSLNSEIVARLRASLPSSTDWRR